MAAMPQSIPFFGRAWRITVDASDGSRYPISSDQFQDALRVTFSINTYMLLAYWTAEIAIYNLGDATKNAMTQNAPDIRSLWQFNQQLVAGDVVTVSAGYRDSGAGKFNPDASILYAGSILQPIWTRNNVVDYVLKLRCMVGLAENLSFVSFPWSKGATAYDALEKTCDQSGIKIENIDSASAAKLQQSTFSRGQVVHGRPYDIVRQFVKQHTLMSWISPRGLNVRTFDPKAPPAVPDYSYAPPDLPGSYAPGATAQGLVKKTLIGTPEQTQDGVLFRVLMDPSVKIGDVVQLAPGTLINSFPIQIGTLPPVPARNGVYVVAGVRHVGDTRGRGDDWFTEIHGVVMDFFADFLKSKDHTKSEGPTG